MHFEMLIKYTTEKMLYRVLNNVALSGLESAVDLWQSVCIVIK